jgi:hypothetical protein
LTFDVYCEICTSASCVNTLTETINHDGMEDLV